MTELDLTAGWTLREQWDALVRGEDCPACEEIKSRVTNDGYWIAQLQISHLRIMRNQFVRGYSVLVCTRHVPEPYDLAPEEQVLFFQDVVRASRALAGVFSPIKMNINMLGNLVPHLHAHLLPRYVDDPAPGRPLDPGQHVVTLNAGEYDECIHQIRAALESD